MQMLCASAIRSTIARARATPRSGLLRFHALPKPRMISAPAIILSDDERKSFIRDGYVVLPGAVPENIVKRAVSFVDQAYAEGKYDNMGPLRRGSAYAAPVFHHSIKSSSQITDLVYQSGLFAAANQLLGEGNAIIRDDVGQVAYAEPNELFVQQGMSKDEPYPADQWHIDSGASRYAAIATDFAFLIGVGLSPGQHVDENRGQFTVWPGSHHITHPTLSEIIFSSPSERVMEKFRGSELNCGEPRRVLLRPGDAFIAHQRLAHAAGINLSEVVRRNIYFRVTHSRLEEFIYQLIHSPTPWAGFSGLQDLLPAGSTSFGKGSQEDNRRQMRRMLGARSVASSLPIEIRKKLSLTVAQKRKFVTDGYLVLRDIVSPELVKTAKDFVTEAYVKGSFNKSDQNQIGSSCPQFSFLNGVNRAPEVTDLYLKSGLVDLSEELLGESNIMVQRNRGSVSFSCTSDISVKSRMSKTAPIPKETWKIDAAVDKYELFGADYLLLVGVVLSEGQDVDENRGQITVWPGSHYQTHDKISEIIQAGGSREDIITEKWSNQIDCCDPRRLLLKPGDVFIAHQRLAHQQSSINLTDEIAKKVFFRILHADFDDILPIFARSEGLFYGFEGLDDLLHEEMDTGRR